MKDDITAIKLSDKTVEVLKTNKVNTLNKLCMKTKTELRNIGLTAEEIRKIEIKLQLKGLDLNNDKGGNKYEKGN